MRYRLSDQIRLFRKCISTYFVGNWSKFSVMYRDNDFCRKTFGHEGKALTSVTKFRDPDIWSYFYRN